MTNTRPKKSERDAEIAKFFNFINSNEFEKMIGPQERICDEKYKKRYGFSGKSDQEFNKWRNKDIEHYRKITSEIAEEILGNYERKKKEICLSNSIPYFSPIEVFQWNEKIKADSVDQQKKTTGYKKMWNYYLALTKTEEFQKKIAQIRATFNTPPGGFERNKNDVLLKPKQIKPKQEQLIRKELRKICLKYNLPDNEFNDVLENYTYYNKLEHVWNPDTYNLFYVADLIEERENFHLFGRWTDEKTFHDDIDAYPVAMRISPYASKRDILDFVEKTYDSTIKPKLEKYKDNNIKIGKIRTRRKRERDNFIYTKHLEGLGGKAITALVAKKFKDENLLRFDVEVVIQKEKNRRKKV